MERCPHPAPEERRVLGAGIPLMIFEHWSSVSFSIPSFNFLQSFFSPPVSARGKNLMNENIMLAKHTSDEEEEAGLLHIGCGATHLGWSRLWGACNDLSTYILRKGLRLSEQGLAIWLVASTVRARRQSEECVAVSKTLIARVAKGSPKENIKAYSWAGWSCC